MLTIAGLIFAISCTPIVVQNKTKYEWNKLDQTTLDSAKNRCVEHYPLSPCLKRFIKTGEQDYQAICGKEKPL